MNRKKDEREDFFAAGHFPCKKKEKIVDFTQWTAKDKVCFFIVNDNFEIFIKISLRVKFQK